MPDRLLFGKESCAKLASFPGSHVHTRDESLGMRLVRYIMLCGAQ